LRGSIQADRQALPSGSHAERPVQGSRRQEHGTTHAGGPRAQQASKLEERLLLSRSEGGTVARACRNTCAPLSSHYGLAALNCFRMIFPAASARASCSMPRESPSRRSSSTYSLVARKRFIAHF